VSTALAGFWQRFADGLNPIWIQYARARLRSRHLLAWGGIVGLLTATVFLGVFLTARMRVGTTVEVAARATFLPVLAIQWFVLVFLGTGSVASGIALERDSGTLDYHRLSPMSPWAKVVGFLFGLPIREYVLFGLTVPFVLIAAILGRMSPLGLLHLYAVFFAGVLFYHLAGLVSGMLAKRGRRAGWIAQAIVVLLYFVLPQLARFGFKFLGYLTIMPALRALAFEELGLKSRELAGLAQALGISAGEDPQFFSFALPTTVYTLLLQGLLITALLVVLSRKWRDPTLPIFSKRGASIVYGMGTLLLVGSVWPSWEGAGKVGLVKQILGFGAREHTQIFFLVSCAAAVFLLWLMSPDGARLIRGGRRARKSGLRRVPSSWDDASTLVLGATFVVTTAAGYYVLLLGTSAGAAMAASVSPLATLGLPVLFGAVVLTLQSAREGSSRRGFLLFFVLLWITPVLVVAVAAAALGPVPVLTIAAGLSPLGAFEAVAGGTLRPDAQRAAEAIVALLFHSALAVLFFVRARRARRRAREASAAH
jgi:hypothetical protein